jgi:drug/metabolite transporter (DMT)-like permease
VTESKGAARAGVVLLVVTCVWGSTFTIAKELLSDAPPFRYLVWRFAIASVLLLPVLWWRRSAVARPRFSGDALLLGLLNAFGLLFQVLGQVYTTASKSSFITSLGTPLTALVGLVVYRIVPTWPQRVAVALASIGLLLLTWPPEGAQLNPGDLLTVACATVYAFYIVESARRAPRHDAFALSVVQVILAVLVFAVGLAVLSLLRDRSPPAEWPALVRLEARPFIWTPRVAWQMAYMSIVCVALIMLAQTWALQRLSATTAAVIFALEPIVATAIAIAVHGASEWPGPRGATGAMLVLCAVYVAERRALRRSASATPANKANSADAPEEPAESGPGASQPPPLGPQM